MRIVFVGTAPFGVPSLRALVGAGHQVPLVVTQPDRPGHRLRLTPPAVKVAAEELGLPVYQPEKIRDPEAVARLREAAPELIVVVAYGQIIPRSILEIPPRRVVNVHASLLPRHRGAAPIAHAILAGDLLTGVTIMQMDEQLDHGPVLAYSEAIPIGAGDHAAALSARLAEIGARTLVAVLERIDQISPQKQNHEQATLAPKLSRADGELTGEEPAEAIDRRVRAFQPWPGVILPVNGERVKVLRGHVEGDRYVPDLVQPPGGRPRRSSG